MCYSQAFGVLGLATTAVGTITGVLANTEAAKAADAEGRYQQQLALYDAIAARNSGQAAAVVEGIRQRRELGTARARLAASNVDLSYGSAARIIAETRRFHAYDSLLLAENVRTRVLAATVAGDVARYNSRVQSQNFQNAAIATGIRGGAQLIGQLSNLIGSGVFGGGEAGQDLGGISSPTERRDALYSASGSYGR